MRIGNGYAKRYLVSRGRSTRIRSLSAALVAAAVFGLCGICSAGTIIQGASDSYLAWEAENDVTITNPDGSANDSNGHPTTWVPLTDTYTGAGSNSPNALFANEAYGTSGGILTKGMASWDIQFSQAGTYYIYVHARYTHCGMADDTLFTDYTGVGSGGAGLDRNSIYVPATNTLGVGSPSQSFDNNGMQGDNLVYHWAPAFASGDVGIGTSYDISAGQVGTPLTCSISIREGGYLVDRIVLSTTAYGLSDAYLMDSLPNSVPEPATMALVGLGAAGLLIRRKRRQGR